MNVRLAPLFLACCAGCFSASSAFAADPPVAAGLQAIQAIESAFRAAIDRARPSVVSIYVVEGTPSPAGEPPFNASLGRFGARDPTDPGNIDFNPASFGSGIILERRGVILTAFHVVRLVLDRPNQFMIKVRLSDGRDFLARIYAADPRSDLASLELQSPAKLDLKPVSIADGGKLSVGQFVLALGNPYSTASADGITSASWGIVSNIRRRYVPASGTDDENVIHTWGTLIQTDARLNMGVSGGALINVQGELVGVTMALSAAVGYETPGGFAVPTDELTRRIIDTLAAGKEVEYGFMGIQPVTVTPAAAEQLGNLPVAGSIVQSIHLPAAYRAGLRDKDIIVAINGRKISNRNELVIAVGSLPVGSVLDAEVVRGRSRLNLKLPLAKFPVKGEPFATNRRPLWNGIRVDHVSMLPINRFDSVGRAQDGGVLVREVKEGSTAYDQGIRADSVITQVNGQPVESPDEFEAITKKAEYPVRLTLDQGRELIIEKPEKKAPAIGNEN